MHGSWLSSFVDGAATTNKKNDNQARLSVPPPLTPAFVLQRPGSKDRDPLFGSILTEICVACRTVRRSLHKHVRSKWKIDLLAWPAVINR